MTPPSTLPMMRGTRSNAVAVSPMIRDPSMKVLQIAILDEDDINPIIVGVREFPVSKLVVVTSSQRMDLAREVERRLSGLKLEIEIKEIKGDVVLAPLQAISEIVMGEFKRYEDVLINIGSTSKMLSCSALAAAFITGVKAILCNGNVPVLLPVLKFSYSELLSENKYKIMTAIVEEGGSIDSLRRLAQKTKIEKSLLSYHLRGSKSSRGLEELGLIEVIRQSPKHVLIKLTPRGKMLLTIKQVL